MSKDTIHYMGTDVNWPPCRIKKDAILTTKFAVKVTCKQCLVWLEKRDG